MKKNIVMLSFLAMTLSSYAGVMTQKEVNDFLSLDKSAMDIKLSMIKSEENSKENIISIVETFGNSKYLKLGRSTKFDAYKKGYIDVVKNGGGLNSGFTTYVSQMKQNYNTVVFYEGKQYWNEATKKPVDKLATALVEKTADLSDKQKAEYKKEIKANLDNNVEYTLGSVVEKTEEFNQEIKKVKEELAKSDLDADAKKELEDKLNNTSINEVKQVVVAEKLVKELVETPVEVRKAILTAALTSNGISATAVEEGQVIAAASKYQTAFINSDFSVVDYANYDVYAMPRVKVSNDFKSYMLGFDLGANFDVKDAKVGAFVSVDKKDKMVGATANYKDANAVLRYRNSTVDENRFHVVDAYVNYAPKFNVKDNIFVQPVGGVFATYVKPQTVEKEVKLDRNILVSADLGLNAIYKSENLEIFANNKVKLGYLLTSFSKESVSKKENKFVKDYSLTLGVKNKFENGLSILSSAELNKKATTVKAGIGFEF